MVRNLRRVSGLCLLLGGAVAACAANDEGTSDGAGESGTGGTLSGTGGTSSTGGSVEQELEETFKAPVVVGDMLFTANPDSNRVARIDSKSFGIDVYPGGHAPSYLATLLPGPTRGGALVINEKSRDASLFLTAKEASEAPAISLVPLHEGASAWATGALGKFAIAWSRSSDGLLGADDGYQDLTVLAFADGVKTTRLSVGYRPNRVFLNADETRAFVVCEPGITVIDLAAPEPTVVRELFLPPAPTNLGRDVSITPNGALALVRLEGEKELLLVDTETDERKSVELPLPATDLDLSSLGDLAVVAMRGDGSAVPLGEGGMGGSSAAGDSLLALLPIPEIFDDPSGFELYPIPGAAGSVSLAKDGSVAALYTNAISSSVVFSFDLSTKEARVLDLKVPVKTMLVSDSGKYAVGLLTPMAGGKNAGAFALVPLKETLPVRIEGTESAPVFVALDSQDRGALITTDGGSFSSSYAYHAQFPELFVDTIPLPSRPLASGVVTSTGKAFVAEEHPEGRVTFVELTSGKVKTVTGFELESKVVNR